MCGAESLYETRHTFPVIFVNGGNVLDIVIGSESSKTQASQSRRTNILTSIPFIYRDTKETSVPGQNFIVNETAIGPRCCSTV